MTTKSLSKKLKEIDLDIRKKEIERNIKYSKNYFNSTRYDSRLNNKKAYLSRK